MEEWQEYRLGELLTIKYGKDHKKLHNGSIPAYGSGGIMRYVNKSIYEHPSILIPRKGSLINSNLHRYSVLDSRYNVLDDYKYRIS